MDAGTLPTRRGGVARALDAVEAVGNRLPDPLTLFVGLAVGVLVLSWLGARVGLAVAHPGTGEPVTVDNLLDREGLRRMLTEAVKNFAAFPPLPTVLVATMGIGVAERSGLFAALLRQLVMTVPRAWLTAAFIFAGVNASLASDAGFVVLVPLGGVLFASVGRHPLAGLVAAYAAIAGGFSANLAVTALDPLLAGMTEAGARLVDTQAVVHPTANYLFMAASVLPITIVGTWVTTRIVEPRLGTWRPHEPVAALGPLDPAGRRALKGAGVALGLGMCAVAALTVPIQGVLRDDAGTLAPFYQGLVPVLTGLFLVPGLVFGVMTGTIRSDRDIAKMATDAVSTMGNYILLAFVASQFVAYFAWTHLGIVTAVRGADALRQVGFTGVPLLVVFVGFTSIVDLFIGSASAKWAIFAPVFVPMFMLLGFTPETVQAAYRVGDSITNPITPFLPYFPLLLTFARRYDPAIRLGTLLAVMLPYTVAIAIVWTLVLGAWVWLGWPMGF